ncbi:carboxylesterase [Cyathus striatus]|nr:carboxylesterase [Cyathus striatus]
MTRLKYLASVILSYSLLVCVLAASPDGLRVHTQQGDVAGTLVSPTVRQFLGVPYATAQRWQAPTTPPARSATFQATNFSDSCVQELSPSAVIFLQLIGRETISRKQQTAVMLWVYGGSFIFGTSNLNYYNGQYIVRDNEDVTIVTFNYRTNIFGQPNAPQLVSSTKSQNFGILDLDAAVQWVYDNIAAFGGDPNRITLFGQSAGSGAVDVYTFAFPNDQRVKGEPETTLSLAVEFNSSLSAIVSTAPATLNATAWNTVANAVGCGSDATAAQFTCMQQVPFRTLENAVISTGAALNPIVDGINIFADVQARSQSGNFLHVPLLSGSTAQEYDIFIVGQELLANGTVIPVLTEATSDALTLPAFTCPAGVAAVQRMNAGVPAWRYQYQAVFPDLSTRPELRAYHASDIPMVFGTYNLSEFPAPATPTEIALSKYMQQAWVAFARNPQSGLLSFGWPMYNPLTASLAQFGNVLNQTGTIMTLGSLIDLLCPH